MADADVNEDLLDYEEEETTEQVRYNTHFNSIETVTWSQIFPDLQTEGAKNGVEAKKEGTVKGNYVSIHSSGFRDFLLKPEILRSIVDCGFEHPSEVQHECIPQVSSKSHFSLKPGAILAS